MQIICITKQNNLHKIITIDTIQAIKRYKFNLLGVIYYEKNAS